MKIEKNKVVALCYELEVEGKIADKTTPERPLDFIFGTGTLLPKFEENIAGLEPGGKFKFTLTPAEGYGEHDPERVIDLPKEAFEIEGQIREDLMKVGTTIPLMTNAGNVVPGVILAVEEKTVKVDVNSPMAGKTLNFSGEILSVREATDKELKEGLHGEYVHSNCGCHGDCDCHGDHEHCGGHHDHDCDCHGDCGCN